jgi:hypothetical protein
MVVPNGLEAGYEVFEDAYPIVRNERCKRRMYGYQFCPHNGVGLFYSRGIYVDGRVGWTVYYRRP